MFIRGQAQYKDRKVLTKKNGLNDCHVRRKGQFHENIIYLNVYRSKSKKHCQGKVDTEECLPITEQKTMKMV
jgi:hypothetical protein